MENSIFFFRKVLSASVGVTEVSSFGFFPGQHDRKPYLIPDSKYRQKVPSKSRNLRFGAFMPADTKGIENNDHDQFVRGAIAFLKVVTESSKVPT